MKKAFSLIALAALLFVAATLQANDPEDILRNLPAPEVHYPMEGIRIKPVPAIPAADPVPLPPPARPYEIRKLVDKAKETSGNPIVKTTRKIVETLIRPKAKVATHTHAIASATISIATGTQSLAAAKPQQTIEPTWVVRAAKTLAENPMFTMLDAKIASETAFAKDVLDLYVRGYESEEKPADEEEQPVAKFDSIMVTAAGLQKKAQWQELKNLFAENPEAGETVEGLRFQIEAEVNSAKPNYMNAQRFARQLLESEGDDPLGHYAMALFYYNSKKPNLTQAKKSLDIALKAKNPPAGASSLYWTMTLKGLAIPLLLVFAGLAGGVAHLIKKRKTAAVALLLENEAAPAKEADQTEPAASSESASPASGFKAKLQGISKKIKELLKKMPFGKGKGKPLPAPEENAANSEKVPDSVVEAGKQSENPAEESDEEQSESSEEEEEIYELEGEDSELLGESDSDSDSGEDAADEQETSDTAEISEPDETEEIIEEVVDEEAGEDGISDEVEIIEIEEEEVDEETDTVEEIIEEIVEEETEEVEYVIEEVEEEIVEEDEPEEKG